MKILVVIPHFYGPSKVAQEKFKNSGSAGSNAQLRAEIVARTINAFAIFTGHAQGMHDIVNNRVLPVNQGAECQINIVLCTSGEYHLVEQLESKTLPITHAATQADPTELGFVCQQVLFDNRDNFEFFCYLEDDIVIHDPLLFSKLDWFNKAAGNNRVLLPHRYELGDNTQMQRLYLDHSMPEHLTAAHRDLQQLSDITLDFIGQPVHFCVARNPHSGCFFLNRGQLAHWMAQPGYFDKDTSLIGPMESAASLGILKHFEPYKPCLENASFLEVEHGDTRYIR